MIHTAHIHDCFKGAAKVQLETMSLGIAFTATKKSLLPELETNYPDLLVIVTPIFWPAFECGLAKVHRRFPTLPIIYLTHHPWTARDQGTRDFLIPHPTLVINLADVNGARFMYAAIDAIDDAQSRKHV